MRSKPLLQTIGSGRWGLGRARETAAAVIAGGPSSVAALVKVMFLDDPELRKRAADVARRMTEAPRRGELKARPEVLFARYDDELAGLLAGTDASESRTRWHLGLVVARVAHTADQRLRAGRLMELLARDASVVVRCSGVEGLALLACAEPRLRGVAEEVCERARAQGTAGERCRARDGLERMAKV